MIRTLRLVALLLVLVLAAGCAGGKNTDSIARPDGVPGPGESRTLDRIYQRGALKVGVLEEFPWLIGGTGNEAYGGPSWTLAQEYAKRLGVPLETVAVSHDTKVSILATGQIDISIAPLGVTEERKNVVDFVEYSQASLCYFGLASNPKLANINDPDDLNTDSLTLAYFVGTPPETFLPERFPQLVIRGVTGSGGDAPIEEILSERADLTIADGVKMPELLKQYPDLKFIPSGDDCLLSNELVTPIGHAIDKGDQVFLAWLTSVQQDIQAQLDQEFVNIVND